MLKNAVLGPPQGLYHGDEAPDGRRRSIDLCARSRYDWLYIGQRHSERHREMLSTAPSYLASRVGILPDILSTLYIVIATLLIVLPLGVGAAIYLNEYAANKKARLRHRIRVGNALRYPVDHLRPCRHADLLQKRHVASCGCADADDHEPADHHAHDTGEPQDRTAELPRGARSAWARANGAPSARWCCQAAWTVS